MPEDEDRIIGKIAVQLGLITPGQLDVLMDLAGKRGIPLGELMIDERAISLIDMQRVIDLRKICVSSTAPQPKAIAHAIQYARQLVREGLLREETADECLRDFAVEGHARPFQDLLVEKGLVPAAKLREFLDRREARHMVCPRCQINFAVKSVSGRKTVECPRCKGPLEERPSEQRKARPHASSVEFATTIIKKVQPVPRPPASDKPPIKAQCIICDARFTATPDASGRIRCTECGSSFTPKP